MLHDGLWCSIENLPMGSEADYIAESRNVSRTDQDAFAIESHRRALAATDARAFAGEIVAVSVPDKKHGQMIVDCDEGPRPGSSLEVLGKLRPSFSPQGTVTPGNASQISDGAAAVVVVNESHFGQSKSPIKARIVATATSGVSPKDIFIAPVTAIEKVLAKARLSLDEIDLIELNEAFAAQCLACMRPLKLDPTKVNVNGGSIALGHPIGASGARVLVTLLYALEHRNLRRGLAALCLGGGNAVAMIVERV